MKTTESNNLEASEAVPRTSEYIQISPGMSTTEEGKWIRVLVGDDRVIWPTHFVSEFNDTDAAY